ncbi:MAG TPA: ClpX C4-type zinc finger protein [Hyalangium sp.]|nr:ClpX C4-type zinc finger protein [Hyalangium sp.]
MANPRDHIRAAQSAELRGDKSTAVAELRKAAELYRRAGNPSRALKLLQHARSLDPSQDALVQEIRRFESVLGSAGVRSLGAEESGAGAVVLELRPEPDELAERQRLIEEALQQAGLSATGEEIQDEVNRWLVEDPPGRGRGPVDLQEASRRALEWALRHGDDEEKLPRMWPVEPGEEVDLPGGFILRRVEEPEPQAVETSHGHFPVKPRPASVGLEVKAIAAGEVTALVADVEAGSSGGASFEEFHSDYEPDRSLGQEEPAKEEPRAKEQALIERGPTRADPAIDAWCSFCCLPRTEVGELVAGPTGSFICAGCVGESGGLLGLEAAQATSRPRSTRRRDEHAEGVDLVGQQDARALLERALQAGARRVLVIGPAGTGKTVWFQELARQERGTLVTLEALEQGTGGSVVLLEDVDRLPPEAQERLGAFLARHPERTVLMSARGALGAPRLILHGATGNLPVLSTRTLSEGVRGSVTESLLEQVQLAIPLQVPSRAELIEIARRRLAARSAEVSVTEDVLAAIAAEAVRSSRSGHELNALLTRVLAGAWSLADPGQGTASKEGGVPKPKAPAKPARRSRRKGKV